MKSTYQKLYDFVVDKIPFAICGLLATSVNFGLYVLLVDRYLPYIPATMIAYSSGVVVNFVLQRYFVFDLNRSVSKAFGITVLTSGIGLALDSLIMYGLHRSNLYGETEWMYKVTTMGILFFYNYYSKKYAFEGTISSSPKPPVSEEAVKAPTGQEPPGALPPALRSTEQPLNKKTT